MIVDTDVLIDYLRGLEKAIDFVESNIDQIAVAAISVAELYQGVKGARERAALDEFVSCLAVYPLDSQVAAQAGLLRRKYSRSQGTGLADAIVGATTISAKRSLATLNLKHYPMVPEAFVPYSKVN